MNKPDPKIIDRIRKLLALSESANEHEAALAAQRAQELLAAHNLNLSNLTQTQVDETIRDVVSETRSQTWRRVVYHGAANLLFCEHYYVVVERADYGTKRGYLKREEHHFVGKSHNIEVAKLTAAFLAATVIRLANDGMKRYPKNEQVRYRQAFRNACATRLYQRIADRIEVSRVTPTAMPNGGNLPALASLYDQELRRNQIWIDKRMKLKTTNTTMRSSHSGGVIEGRQAGDSISLETESQDDDEPQASLANG